MYFARCREEGPDGPSTRILVADRPGTSWIDLRLAERLRHERRGASSVAALRLAQALAPASMSAAIAGGEAFLEAAAAALADASGAARREIEPHELVAALDPSGYRDFMIFEGHFSFGYRWQGKPVPEVMYELPVGYLGNPASFIGPGDEVPWPSYTRHMDYELELGIVIGRGGSDLTPEQAAEHIFGFTILNDFSARDIQLREMEGRLGPCKGKHFACGAGPLIATADELDWRAGMRMTARLNGDPVCDAHSSEAIWGLDEIVAWTSQGESLQPGWLLGSGTCNGGSGVETDRRLQPGDRIELEIEGLGVLRNTLGAIPAGGWTPPPRAPQEPASN
ncbi:MAG TPA: fumarylacetoacetate hydrolase family protein [Solirubrobacterales bacterium]|jgi:2-keto-4-pentenoate hydratase/2-oxohepta-3-ene-1,7-dioic acid hydratase in catechol pathway